MRSPLAAYKAALKAVKAYKRGSNDTDAAAAAALGECIAALRAAHPAVAALTAGWDTAEAAEAVAAGGAIGAAAAPGSSGGAGAAEDGGPVAKRPRQQEAAAAAEGAGVSRHHSAAPAVVHSFDLGLDEPAYLAAAALLALSRLRAARAEPAAAVAAPAAAALALFPACAAAHLAIARALLSEAASQGALAAAERHLRAAVAAGEALAEAEGGLMVDSNKACAAEAAAAADARAALAMLLCQQGRDAEAAQHLAALGYAWRLARGVLHYPLPGVGGAAPSSSGGGGSAAAAAPADGAAGASQPQPAAAAGGQQQRGQQLPLAVLDSALPPAMLQRLQRAFAPSSPFWAAHGYGPRQGYFSYAFMLDGADTSLLSQLAAHLRTLALPHFPEVAEARFAEWWVHCRHHPAGHQLHFDSDDEGVGGVRNPIISSVVYLSSAAAGQRQPGGAASSGGGDGGGAASGAAAGSSGRSGNSGSAGFVGGPTLVTDQRLGGPLATQGWLAYPAANRVTLFDGRVLHGVIPGRGASPDPSARRVTLMVAFWRELRCRLPVDGAYCAAMPMPSVPSAGTGGGGEAVAAARVQAVDACQSAAWLSQIAPLAQASHIGSMCSGAEDSSQQHAPCMVLPKHLDHVWEPVAGRGTAAPTYDACFQGF